MQRDVDGTLTCTLFLTTGPSALTVAPVTDKGFTGDSVCNVTGFSDTPRVQVTADLFHATWYAVGTNWDGLGFAVVADVPEGNGALFYYFVPGD